MDYHSSDVQRVDFQRQAIESAEGHPKDRQVFVGGVSMYASEDDLMRVFETAGTVVALRWGVDRRAGNKFKGFVHVEFSHTSAVPLAVSKTGTDVCGRNIRVSAARGPSDAKSAGKKKQDNFIVDTTGSSRSSSSSSGTAPEKKGDVCLRCRDMGHKMSDCPMMRGGGPSSDRKVAVSCYNCGGNSHRASHCRKEKIGNGFTFATCFICGTKGHLASQCAINKQGMYPNGGGCRVCGSNQHLVKDCPEKVSKKEKKKRKREKEAAEHADDTGYYNNSVAEDSLGGNFAVEMVAGGSVYKESLSDDEDDGGEGSVKKKKKKKKHKKSKHEKFDEE
jgi:hypothetical protein